MQETFDLEVARATDKTGGMAGLLGKAALPKIDVDLFIIDWESAKGGVPAVIKGIKAKCSGNYRFLVVADKRFAAEMANALKAGATDCILKPFTAAEFKEKLDNVTSAKPMTVSSYSVGKLDISKKAPAKPSAPTVTSFTPGISDLKKPAPIPAAQPPKPAAPPRPNIPMPPPSAYTGAPKIPAASATVTGPTGGKTAVGGPSFYTSSAKKKVLSDVPTATLIDGQINGHYHEKVDVIGGGENCYWAREVDGDKVRLEYLSAKGTATGIEAKVIDRHEFMHSYYLCAEHGCHILKRLGQWPPPQQ